MNPEMSKNPSVPRFAGAKVRGRWGCHGPLAACLAAGLGLWSLALPGQTVLNVDFNAPQAELCQINAGGGAIAGGVLTLGKKDAKCNDSARFKLAVDGPFELAFSMRSLGTSLQTDHHWGAVLIGANGREYTFGGTSVTSRSFRVSEGGQILRKTAFPEAAVLDDRKQAGMVRFAVRVERGFAEGEIDGQPIGAVPLEFMALEGLCFYAYNMQIQVDDLQVMRIQEKQENYVPGPVFVANFDQGPKAIAEDGRELLPEGQPACRFEPGVTGQALALGGQQATDLVYPVGPILGDAGAIMFWTSPAAAAGEALQLLTEDGKVRMICRATPDAFAAKVRRSDGAEVELASGGSHLFYRNDWNHYAVTWEQSGAIRVFRNGLPYIPANSWTPNIVYSSGRDFADVRRLVLLQSAGSRLDDVTVYRRPVSPREIYAEFRRRSPLDVVIAAAVVAPEEAASLTVRFAPGGTYTRPAQGDAPPTGAAGDLSLTLYSCDGTADTVALRTMQTTLKVGKDPVDIAFPVGKLPVGDYRVQWSLTQAAGVAMRRSIAVKCLADFVAAPASLDDVRLGNPLFEKTFTDPADPGILKEGTIKAVDGRYLEADAQRGSRISVVVPGLEDYRQKPVIVEMLWPDDKPRMMGIYGYMENKKGENYRDRIQGGVQAGRELPNTGKMIATRYLFYPKTPSFLFEVRTLANGFPAAIAALRVYPVQGETLPRLAIAYPDNMEHRRLGNTDEDQTLSTNMGYKTMYELTGRILEYMDYTGQDTFHYPITRYYFSFFPFPGSPGNGLHPDFPGGVDYMVEAFAKRGKRFVGILNLGNLPELEYAQALDLDPADLVKAGLVSLDKDNYTQKSFDGVALRPNLANPRIRAAVVRYLEDFETALKKPNFQAISVWQTMGWGKLERGYDDYTVGRFAADTGVQVPPDKRYEFLTGPDILPKWQAWRAEQVFLLIKAMREALDRINPKVEILVIKRGETDWDEDLDAKLKSLKNVYACDMRRPTRYRHAFHWGKPEGDEEERLYDVAANRALVARKSNESVSLFYTYYETFEKPLDPKNYGCYFQDADVKPHSRLFLKELAFDVAAGDMLEIVMGGQPFGSFGREAETREFARAFAALPQRSFRTVPGTHDNITVRYLPTENGTYFYVVSLLWTDAEAQLQFAAPVQYRDLSSGETASDGRIRLKPFQLRSFLIPRQAVAVCAFTTKSPPELRALCQARARELEGALQLAASRGLPLPDEKVRMQEIGQLLANENYVEAHRLSWSLPMNTMLEKVRKISLVLRQEQLIKAGRIAVNCGSDQFYEAAAGRLFFPDQQFTGKTAYGYYGPAVKSVVRKIDGIKDQQVPSLFQTEAYDLDGYRFRLPNGKYRLRLYLKIGYPGDFKGGQVRFSVAAQDLPLFSDLDLYEAGNGDFMQPVVRDYDNIVVKDGLLDLKFAVAPGRPSNHRLCNGIEITPGP